jgi:anti-sigma factor RsiW
MNEARHLDLDTLNALVDDAIPESERPGIMRHLAGCAACQQELAELRATARLCAGLPQFTPLRPFTLGPEYGRHPVNLRLLQTLPVVRSLAVAAVLVFVLISAFAVINTRHGSASSSATDRAAPAQQTQAGALAPGALRGVAPAPTEPASDVANEASAARPASAGAKSAPDRSAARESAQRLSGWWIASLIIGLGTALLLLSWFALDRGGMRRYGRLSSA